MPLRTLSILFFMVSLVNVTSSFAVEPVQTAQGPVVGVEEHSLTVYRGIPFATPPLANLRWRPPSPPQKRNDILLAAKFRDPCMQAPRARPGPQPDQGSEDCLYLNLWVPEATDLGGLPVMVWIHGGAFARGSGSDARYAGNELAKKGVIVATFNYRVGHLGFLAHPELSQESEHDVSGNYGLLDQIAALQWIKQNIAAFGGDPERVTIFGESTGSTSVHLLVSSPLAKGLFRAAIAESGAALDLNAMENGISALQTAEQEGAKYASNLGANSLAQLRRLPASTFIDLDKGAGSGTVWPFVDGHVLPDAPYIMLLNGAHNDVLILTGNNANEGTLFVQYAPENLEDYILSVNEQYGALAEQILDTYPASTDAEAKAASADLYGDTAFGFEQWVWARTQAKYGKSPIYYYHFSHAPNFKASSYRSGMGATHAAELAYVFGHADPDTIWSDYDFALSETIMTYWSNFAKNLDPNAHDLPHWPAFNNQEEPVMHFSDEISLQGVPFKNRFLVLNKYFTQYQD